MEIATIERKIAQTAHAIEEYSPAHLWTPVHLCHVTIPGLTPAVPLALPALTGTRH